MKKIIKTSEFIIKCVAYLILVATIYAVLFLLVLSPFLVPLILALLGLCSWYYMFTSILLIGTITGYSFIESKIDKWLDDVGTIFMTKNDRWKI